MDEQIIKLLVHLFAFLLILVPFYQVFRITKKERGQLTKSLFWLFLGFTPIAIYHLLEALSLLNITRLLPPENTLLYYVVEHGVVIIAFATIIWFLYFFNKEFIRPFYG